MTENTSPDETVHMTGVADGGRTARLRFHPTDEAHRVTSLELFFDLVFVYAITQVTAFMAHDPTWGGALKGLILLGMLWFSWASYSWLTNTAKADEGLARLGLVSAMVGIFVVALAVPEAYHDQTGGLHAPVVFAFAFVFVHAVHLVIFAAAAAAGRDGTLRVQLMGMGAAVVIGKGLYVVGALMDEDLRVAIWGLALLLEYTGVFIAAGVNSGRITAPGHFAERHGLIIIIAIGESIVAIGLGAADEALSLPVILAVVFGLAISLVMWWTYFDVVALVAERVLERATGEARARLGRDSYTYLHFPMVMGIVYVALGLKTVVKYVADSSHHELSEALPLVPLLAMYGGVTLYLLAHVAFRWRNVHSINKQRVVVATSLLLLSPFMRDVPALAALGVLAAVLVSLIAYEATHFKVARHAVRHGYAANILKPDR